MNCRVCGIEATAFAKISTKDLDEPFLDATLRAQLPELRLSRCDGCGCLWATDDRQCEEVLLEAYSRVNDSYFDSEHIGQRHREFYKWLENLLEEHHAGGSILDVGCGDGSFLAVLSDKWNKHGIEPSKAVTRLSTDTDRSVKIAAC